MVRYTKQPIFSNGTEAMVFIDTCCSKCAKYTQYNEKLGRYPAFKCAIQRDIELQQVGHEEISQRSYDMVKQYETDPKHHCPLFKDKEKARKERNACCKAQRNGTPDLFRPNTMVSKSDRQIINIVKEHKEQKKREQQEAKDKALDNALAKANERRLRQSVPTNKGVRIRKETPQLRQAFQAKGKKIKVEIDEIAKVHLSNMHIVIRCMIDMGECYMQDVVSSLSEQGRFKQNLKHQIGLCRAAYDKVSKRIDSTTSSVDELRNAVLDQMYDEVNPDIQRLLFSIKRVLDRNNIPNSLVKAQAETTWVLFKSACQAYRIIFDAGLKMIRNVFIRERISVPTTLYEEMNAMFYGKDPEPISKAWEKVAALVCDYPQNLTREIGEDANVKTAIVVVQRKLSDVEHIDNIGEKILDDNPHMLDKYEERLAKYEQENNKHKSA